MPDCMEKVAAVLCSSVLFQSCERGGFAAVALGVFLDTALVNEILKFFVSTKAQHLLASIGGVSIAEVGVHDQKQRLEFEPRSSRKHTGQLQGKNIWAAALERMCFFHGLY